ncbi:MAG: hypothetical protein KBD78_06075 [Oligoflexales bacterium]|nr:hypothetical protein [Oligoflexales bacterium]
MKNKLIKSFGFLGFFCAFLALNGLVLNSQLNAQDLAEKVTFEDTIKSRLSDKLKMIIDPELFRVFANAQVKQVSEKIILSGETQQQSDGLAGAKKPAALPGFELMEKAGDAAKVQQASTSKFKYNHYIQLTQLDVHLLLDQSIAEDKKNYVKEVVEQDLKNSFGDKAKLHVKDLAFVDKPVNAFESAAAWFKSYLDKRGGSGLDLLYLVLLVLAFLFAIATLIRKMRKSAAGKNLAEAGASANKTQIDKPENLELMIEGILNRLVEQVSKHPLQVSCFLKQLQVDHKKALLSATKTPALTMYFQQLMGFFEAEEYTANGSNNSAAVSSGNVTTQSLKDLKSKLVHIEQDLERYLKIQNKQVNQQFGYLPLLEDRQISEFIAHTGQKIRTLSILAKFLAKPQFAKLTEELNLDEKVELFKAMQTSNYSESELEQLDGILRAKYELLKDHSAVLVTDVHELEKAFLENDNHVMDVINRLVADNFPLGPSYEKYKITFDKLVDLEGGVVRQVIQKVSNETLAKAFAHHSMSSNVRSSLGEMRGKLIESMKARYTYIDKNEIDKAQNEILKTYWAMV